jgi:ribosomal protein S18 acetylase RimI-like enzyme
MDMLLFEWENKEIFLLKMTVFYDLSLQKIDLTIGSSKWCNEVIGLGLTQAKMDDIDTIIDLYHTIVHVLQKEGNDQWDKDYLNDDLIKNDIKNGKLYGIKEAGRFIAVLVLTEEKKPQYDQVNWQFTEGKNLYIHRVAVHPDFQGRGLSKKLLNFAQEFANENGYANLRLDAYNRNPVALNLYRSFGFEEREEISMPGREEKFVCFEKKVL